MSPKRPLQQLSKTAPLDHFFLPFFEISSKNVVTEISCLTAQIQAANYYSASLILRYKGY